MGPIGVIGLGNMGGGIAATLLDRGWAVVAFDLDPARVAAAEALGAKPAADCAALAAECEAVMTFLPMAPSQPVLEQTVLGDGGLIEHLRPGACVIDCGNTSPTLTRTLGAGLAERGLDFIDAPISGGPQGAQAGTATAMVGGKDAVVDKWRPLLEAIGARYQHFGGIGAGQMAKLCNNILVAANLAALSEVLVFAERNDIDIAKLVEMISESAGGSWVLDNYGREIIAREGREEEVGPRLEYSRDRQLFWALEMADRQDIPLSMTGQAHKQFMMARGLNKRGSCEPIVEMLEDMTGADVVAAKKA